MRLEMNKTKLVHELIIPVRAGHNNSIIIIIQSIISSNPKVWKTIINGKMPRFKISNFEITQVL